MPTIAEAGVPGYEVDSWQGVFVPAKSPDEIVQKMNAGIEKALTDPAVVKKLAETAYTTTPSSPEDLGKFLQADTQKWAAIIKAADLKID